MRAAARAAPSISTVRYWVERPISSAMAAAMTSGWPSQSPCSVRRRSAPGGAAHGSSAQSGGVTESRGTDAGSPPAPCRSRGRPGRPPGRRRPDGGTAHGHRRVPPAPLRSGTSWIDTRPGDDDHAQCGHTPLRFGEGGDDAPQQMLAHTRAPDGDQADLLVRPVAQFVAQRLAIGEDCGSKPVMYPLKS